MPAVNVPGIASTAGGARMYVDAGMDMLDKLTAADPVELRRTFVDYVAHGFRRHRAAA